MSNFLYQNFFSSIWTDKNWHYKILKRKNWFSLTRTNPPYNYALYIQSAQATLARSCFEDENWANTKISAVYWVGRWQTQPRSSKLRFKDVCKRDLKSLNVRTDEWELLANDRAKWRSTVRKRQIEREQRYNKYQCICT